MIVKEHAFDKVQDAIIFIQKKFKSQPSLDIIASEMNSSAFYFQKIFSEWAGVSPKKFLQYISLDHAKKIA